MFAGFFLPSWLFAVAAHAEPVKTSVRADPTFGMPLRHLAPPATKPAHWIWLGPAAGDQQLFARTAFRLRSRPRTGHIWITGDDAFTLFINGHQVDQSQPVEQGWSRPHQAPIAPYLRAGKNVIAVQGVNVGGGAAGIVVELDIDNAPALVSGSQWKALLSTSPPAGWTDALFNDTSWQNATDEGAIGTGVWSRNVADWPGMGAGAWYMAHRTMRPVSFETLSGPGSAHGINSLLQGKAAARVVGGAKSAVAIGPSQILLDFGRELSGRLEVAGTVGAPVEVHTGESREACLRILTDRTLIAIDNSGPWLLTLNGSAVQTTPYTAFRYALLTFPGTQPVTLTKADCDFKFYPVAYRGSFACSDPLLTRVWYAGAYTAHLCMQEDIWDSPKRDRGLWIGDLHVTGATINTVFADRFLMEKTIAGGRAAAQGGRPDTQMPEADVNNIPGYTAAWFGTLADFYRHDGDFAFLRSQHKNIVSLLAFQQTQFDSKNLFANPKNEWDFCDWAPGYVQHTPQTLAATDLFAIYGVRQAVFLLQALGDSANARKYEAWAETLTQAARRRLVDPRTLTYGDRLQGNAMAVYSGVATPPQQAEIFQTILRAGTPAWTAPVAADLAGSEVMSPFGGNYVLRAYGKLGQFQAGIDLVRRYWGLMLARGTSTLWEEFDPAFPQDMNVILGKMPYLSLSHGWSSGPTSYLTEYVLGVQPTAGGFRSVTIQPELGDLKWATGAVPTPHGDIKLHVGKVPNGIVCTLTLPGGIHAIVKLPGRTVTLDRAGKYVLKGRSGSTPKRHLV